MIDRGIEVYRVILLTSSESFIATDGVELYGLSNLT